jgi:hypothetical protein|tara:strand:+ start:569 stop:892 length:324 start_codon:yes stop_codon:yes gene_type:complete
MANGLGIIAIIVGVLLAMTLFRGGVDELKAEPLQSTLESGKQVFEAGKNLIEQGTETFNQVQNQQSTEPTPIEVGQIPCANDNDCNEFLSQCEDVCSCVDLICWREE